MTETKRIAFDADLARRLVATQFRSGPTCRSAPWSLAARTTPPSISATR
uniref:Uncharacterized protein n=1 Tax=Phenylobacterium glaciei TaxID=2803784 RepID=A0A974P1E2_9CAUL|nr:hypothetical protein JKL49_18865 [Phenylobacterium glaciei]